MQLKISFPTILFTFLLIILAISAFTIHFYFRNNLLEGIDNIISNWGEVLSEKINNHYYDFKSNPSNFIVYPKGKEYPINSMVVYFADKEGHSLAHSDSLQDSDIKVNPEKDDYLSESLFRGKVYRTYQLAIVYNNRLRGYIVTGVPITAYYQSVQRFGLALIIITFCTTLILGLGIFSLTSLNILTNQKKFLNFASHELKIPLSVILGNTELLLKKKKRFNSEEISIMNAIKDRCVWMNKLVTNLLLVFRTESGSEKIQKKPFDLGDLVIEEYLLLKTRYPEKNINLNVVSKKNTILADQNHIRKLISNLLDNAAKYTATNGNIKISLNKDQNNFIIEVEDDGAGIKKEFQKKIFTPYFRIDPTSQDGIGLGLAICKWVVDQHKGKIELVSSSGKGTKFKIILPCEPKRNF